MTNITTCSHVSRTTLTRLARLDLTDLLLRDGAPHLAAHLDTFLWALHHARAEHAPEHTAEISEDQLQRTWLTFVGGGLHPALASREAETEHLETVASRLVPLALASHHCQSPVSSSVATALLANVVLQPLLGQHHHPKIITYFSRKMFYTLPCLDLISEPRIINKLLLLWFSPEPVKIYSSCPEPPVRLLVR